ncbi:UvrD-helicase domain-containing protein [Novosphingobium olei]|uniref:UvrD-helicase domain-containing protein n=1 Tax=Novosphingobium olei TaxID=2728851 RepID=UPI0030853A40|nr:UvrD-helicase domain-containing protein [Novosphingobium olei]
MRSFADQLKQIGLVDHQTIERVDVSRIDDANVQLSGGNSEKLILELPLLGRVTRIEESRGFGFISADDGKGDFFFHLKGYAGRRTGAEELPPSNSKILFIAGSDWRRPTEKEAVRWFPVSEVPAWAVEPPADQEKYDQLRSDRLRSLNWGALWRLLRAEWYSRQWRNDAPADLEDSTLEAIWNSRLSEIDVSELAAGNFWDHLSRCHYRFAARLHPSHPQRGFDLNLFEPRQLAALGSPKASWMHKADEPMKIRLMEWHLRCADAPDDVGDWSSWFLGTQSFERDLAEKLLGERFEPSPFVDQWLARLAANALLSTAEVGHWAEGRPATALALFEHLPQENKRSYFDAWRAAPGELAVLEPDPSRYASILTSEALSIDLETDGEAIWEVGCAQGKQARRLFDRGSSEDLAHAMSDVFREIRSAPLVVGHNVLAWDWPIIERFAPSSLSPLVWDTLLVQFLLQPGGISHALGGNHHADGDALAVGQLFEKQLLMLNPQFARSVLLGEFEDAGQLLAAIPQSLRGALRYAREMPANIVANADPHELLILSKEQLRALDWVPNVAVVSADPLEALPPELLQIDVEALKRIAQEECWEQPAAKVVLAVSRIAAEEGISLRRNMIPFWLLEGDPALASALERASIVPQVEAGWRVAPIPSRPEWWRNADPAAFSLGAAGQDVFIFNRQRAAVGDMAKLWSDWQSAPLIYLKTHDGITDWVRQDRAAHVLERSGGLQRFATRRLPSGVKRLQAITVSAVSARPVLAARRHHVLHPGAFDQLGYWTEVLRTVREMVQREDQATPLLLIGSSENPELVRMLEVALAELGLGEVRPDHRSKREHLLRASRNRYAVVDLQANWSNWHALSQSAEVDVQPIVEALPLEEWYACSQERGDGSGEAQTADEVAGESEPPSQIRAIGTSSILEAIPTLAAQYLPDWLAATGLSDSMRPAILMDSRLAGAARELTRIIDVVPLHEMQLTAVELERLGIALAPFKIAREEAPTDFASMERFLVENWNPKQGQPKALEGFKPSQRSAMEAICARSSHVLVSLPTGEGKSVLFQVPALCRGLRNRRLTLVISPLKALMRDQVEGLRDLGFAESVDFLSSDRPKHEIDVVMQGVLDHRLVLLYVAPERLRSAVFLDVLEKRMRSDAGLDHVVIDEAHCVNQWGVEFRPDYFHATDLLLRKCRELADTEPTPFLLLSATITASDKQKLEAIVSGSPDQLPMLVRPETFAHPIRSHIAILPRRVRGRIGGDDLDKAMAERLPIIEKAIFDARQNRLNTGQRSAVIVFVPTRRLAEDLARRLSEDTGGNVEFYHAGLDAATKEEVYADFRDGELDVLVATKAFGMGMDIPDIHWVVHLSPPGHLEDYLQEVGRIGRGQAERERAELAKLSALLPFSNEDFEHIRDLRARNTLRTQDIDDVFGEIRKKAHEVDGQLIAVVPAEGYVPLEHETERRAAATRLRMAIYWLERAGRLTLSGSLADVLTIGLTPDVLEKVSQEEGPLGELAELLLHLEDAETCNAGDGGSEGGTSGRVGGEGLLARLLEGLVDMVGLAFGGSPKRDTRPMVANAIRPSQTRLSENVTHSERQVQSERIAVINLSQIRFRLRSMASNDDVLAALIDLEKRGGVSLNREIEFSLRRLASEREESIRTLFNLVDDAVKRLLGRLAEKACVDFHPFDLVEIEQLIQAVALESAAEQGGEPGPRSAAEMDEEILRRRRRMYERAFINGFRTLARSSGVRLRQLADEDESVLWEAQLAQSENRAAHLRRKSIVRGAQSVFRVVKESDKRIAISKLVDRVREAGVGGKFRERDLKMTAGLLAAMNLVGMTVDLVQFSHVVLLHEDQTPHADLWDELAQINDFSEARNLAMELFANVRMDAQDGFISGYFSQSDASGLKDFLETQLGEIEELDGDADGQATSGIIAQMQEKLRATKAVEFFEKFRNSEEPAQWEAVCHPFNQHLLVNAGPGAGKTTVLVGRIVHLIREQHIHPSQIVVLAFNRAVVFEIKRRIRELFRSLGYAAYASRLRVSTIHAFAMRHLAKDGWQGDDSMMDGALSEFARRMEGDADFRRSVAGDVRCILVDEFQDLTDEVYSILRTLYEGSEARAGVMVIGDDDQDILRWQRPAGNFSETYFDRFAQDFGGSDLKQLLLSVNFRSGKDIVQKSQAMVSAFFERSERSRRLKNSTLVSRQDAPIESVCLRIDWRGKSFGDAVGEVLKLWPQIGGRTGESVAILCRSNAEVAEAHRLLEAHIPGISVQGMANLRVANLRHVALWLDFLRSELVKDDRALTAQLSMELVGKFIGAMNVPEKDAPSNVFVSLEQLWNLCCQEQEFPHISSLIRFVEELRSDDLSRLLEAEAETSSVVVSTIHKVKGLEFDNVVVLPSNLPFGNRRYGKYLDLEGDAAEEARLLYVAMTRAKRNLWQFVGDREYSWARSSPAPFDGQRTDGCVLIGSPEDVGLGWALQRSGFNTQPEQCQAYIEQEVKVGDPVALGGIGLGAHKALLHRSPSGAVRQIGFLAKKHGAGSSNSDLRVSSVIRFYPNDASDGELGAVVTERGWGYVALVSGRIR